MFDKLMNLLIVEDEKPPVPPTTPQQQAPQPSYPAPAVTSTPTTAPPMQRAENPQFVEALMGALREKALIEYDYLKFLDGQKALAPIISDESVRFKSVYLTAKSMGVTKDKLVETAKYYLSILTDERKQFLQGAEEQQKDKIGNSEQQIKDLETQISGKVAKIKELEAKLKESHRLKEELESKISQWKTKIRTSMEEFDVVFSRLEGTIQSDINKMNSYLEK